MSANVCRAGGIVNSLLKWAGAKRWQVPTLRSFYRNERLVELFCGSCAITFGLEPKRALLNDLNPHLINFYRQVQRGFSFDIPGDPAAYYAHREWFNALIRAGETNNAEAAQLFYFLNHVGFNGLCRFNARGEFNVPVRPTARPCPTFEVDPYRIALSPWTFTCGSYSEVTLEPDDFVYADPPYDGVFTGYTGQAWTRADAENLALLLVNHPGRVVMMNADTPWTRELYQSLGYHLTFIASAQRMQNSRGRNDTVLEVMATNFPVDTSLVVPDDGRRV